jgi:hypothetical protein
MVLLATSGKRYPDLSSWLKKPSAVKVINTSKQLFNCLIAAPLA